MSLYEFDSNYDITDAVFESQMDIIKLGKERTIDNEYEYLLLYNFVLN